MAKSLKWRSVRSRHSRASRRSCGFTLIELLVVVGLVTSLLSMLLPSLRAAREQARMVVCFANTSNIAQAAAGYSSESNGWLCGSPGTSGGAMLRIDPRPEPDDEDIDTAPVQIWDYAGPLAGTYMNLSLPSNRAERFKVLRANVFTCPSNRFVADPYPQPVGTFTSEPLVSYNTFRNFLMWSRTMVDRDPNKPWGVRAPFPEASFDMIGGNTLQPKNHIPNINRIANPSGKAYLADGNRFTDENGKVTYDLEWDALDGGAFCNGGPTLREWDGPKFVLSSYHYDKLPGSYGYRHRSRGERGIVVAFFDAHSEFMTESQSRQPDAWWPKGTVIPFPEFNEPTRLLVGGRLDSNGNYLVGR